MTVEHAFNELGFFDERTCEAIKRNLEGRSVMNFVVGWDNDGDGNCTLAVSTSRPGVTEEGLAKFFLWCALNRIEELDTLLWRERRD